MPTSGQSKSSPKLNDKSNPIKKTRKSYSIEFKAKVVAQLKNSDQTTLGNLYNIDRRVIGTWAKAENKIA